MRRLIGMVLASVTSLSAMDAARADWKPSKAVEFVVTAGPGGGTDQFARVVQAIVTKYELLGQPAVVVNKGGGSGAEGFVYASGAKARSAGTMAASPGATFQTTGLLEAYLTQQSIGLKTECPVTSYEQDDRSDSVVLKSGERIAGAPLVAADGLRSAIRARMVGDGAPRIEGHTTYRSVIPIERMPDDLRWNAATPWAGAKFHLVHYPLQGWKVFNLAITTHNDPQEAVAGKPVSHLAHAHTSISCLRRKWIRNAL